MGSRPLFLLLLCFLVSCDHQNGTKKRPLTDGPWRFVFDLNGHPSPVIATVSYKDTLPILTFINAEERIEVEDIAITGDSINIKMPLYDTEFIGAITNEGRTIAGHWRNHNRGADYAVPFIAVAGNDVRFALSKDDAAKAEGRWAATFDPQKEEPSHAIGIFEPHPNGRITGTFATETGDHRYLEGVVRNDSLLLSSFDGSHVYLFEARIAGDSLSGRFNSGIHWEERWVAAKDPSFDLRDPGSITRTTSDNARMEFEFADLEGRPVSSNDPRFLNKVMVVQVMGSWCSNCADEALSLNALYRDLKKDGLEIVALAFEKQSDPERAINVLRRFSKGLAIDYPVLFAGQAKKEVVAEKLPFIDRIRSYPTTIFIDHTGRVRDIHTGYYGPGTGQLHDHYQRKIRHLITELLNERRSALAAR